MRRFAAGAKIGNFLDDGVDFGAIGSSGVANEAALDANTALNNARTAGVKMRAIAQVQSAKNMAEARVAGAKAQSGATLAGVAGDVVGGVSGLIGSSFGGGGSSFGSSAYSSLGSRDYGIWDKGASFNVPSTF